MESLHCLGNARVIGTFGAEARSLLRTAPRVRRQRDLGATSRTSPGELVVRCTSHTEASDNSTVASASLSRRAIVGSAVTLAAVGPHFGVRTAALAEEDGFKTYERGNRERFETSISSATLPYEFVYPDTWKPEIVSLNDGKLYGVDLRLGSKEDGQVAVSVLPYGNRDSIEEVGTPEDALDTFLELVGAFWDENGFGDTTRANTVVRTDIRRTDDGQVYYTYELGTPHSLIAANATNGQLYLMNVSATNSQWRKSQGRLRAVLDSFKVPVPTPEQRNVAAI